MDFVINNELRVPKDLTNVSVEVLLYHRNEMRDVVRILDDAGSLVKNKIGSFLIPPDKLEFYSFHVNELEEVLNNEGSFVWGADKLIPCEPFEHNIVLLVSGENGKITINDSNVSEVRKMESFQITSYRTNYR